MKEAEQNKQIPQKEEDHKDQGRQREGANILVRITGKLFEGLHQPTEQHYVGNHNHRAQENEHEAGYCDDVEILHC